MENNNTNIVLVIDDDMEMHSILKLMLDFWECTTISALNAYDGIAMAVKYNPMFIILDLDMPEINGERTLKLLKTIELTKNIPVVILSASLDKKVIVKTKLMGAADFITKPFSHELFIQRIAAYLPKQLQERLNIKNTPRRKS